MFISFPGDESEFGGCLSAGRGFIHVGSDGSIEPCPFAPYSKDNIENVTLREALRSTFMENIRNNHEMLSEDTGGCALFKNKEWVKQLAEEN
jgi:MoaA/NifB/PqqE/SkfB family radical SAM enzyme